MFQKNKPPYILFLHIIYCLTVLSYPVLVPQGSMACTIVSSTGQKKAGGHFRVKVYPLPSIKPQPALWDNSDLHLATWLAQIQEGCVGLPRPGVRIQCVLLLLPPIPPPLRPDPPPTRNAPSLPLFHYPTTLFQTLPELTCASWYGDWILHRQTGTHLCRSFCKAEFRIGLPEYYTSCPSK